MLPFIQDKKVGSVSKATIEDGEIKMDDEMEMLEASMQSLFRAINMKDTKAMASAFKDAFEICESYPHDENDVNEEGEG